MLWIPLNANDICDQAVVYAQSSYFYFGGYSVENGYLSIIARLDEESLTWTKVGQLNRGRSGHNAIHLNGHFIVVGGYYTRKTEKCLYNNNQMVCKLQYPSLNNYARTPELMAVPGNYCISADPCGTGQHNCDKIASCTNTDDGFECTCPEGFTGVDGTQCEDIDECQDSIHDCTSTQKCINTIGSYKCLKGKTFLVSD